MNFFDVIIFGSGTVFGIYLNQRYRLPHIESMFKGFVGYLKQYEPPRKNEDIVMSDKI